MNEMKSNDNKQFWSRFAGIYEKFTVSGENASYAYDMMIHKIIENLNEDMNVLELAAGPGVISTKIASSCKRLEATDFSEEMIKVAKKKEIQPNLHFAVADATKMSYEDDLFDAVIIANALHIMPYPNKALEEIRRVLRDDGILIAPNFTRDNVKSKFVERLMETFGFKTYRKWTHDTYKAYLSSQGWEILKEDVITGHNFPISFLVVR